MGRRILFINLILLAGLLALSWQLVSNWQEFDAEEKLRVVISENHLERVERVEPVSVADREEEFSDVMVIAERDLFSPDRRLEIVEGEEDQEPKAPEFPKRPQMSGVSEIDGVRKALLTIFASAKGPGQSRMVTVGEPVQGYVVETIEDTTLTLRWNDQIEVIDMLSSDRDRPSQPSTPARATAAVNIIRVGTKVAAVESTSTSSDEEGDRRSVQVGTLTTQGQRAGSAASGAQRPQQTVGRGAAGNGQNVQQQMLPVNVNLPDRPSAVRRPPENRQ